MNTYPINITPHPHSSTEPCPGGCDDLLDMEKKICNYYKEVAELTQRIQNGHDQMIGFEARMGETSDRIGRMESALSVNTHKLDLNNQETSEILEIMKDGKAFFKFVHKAGEVFKWVFGLCTAALIFFYAVRDWNKH